MARQRVARDLRGSTSQRPCKPARRRHSSFAASRHRSRINRAPYARDCPAEEGFRSETAQMKKLIIPATVLTVMQNTASDRHATGPSALALAAVIAQYSPALRAFEKPITARLFRGDTRFGFTSNTKIPVDADSATGM